MIATSGRTACGHSEVEVDPWVPLKVTWQICRSSQPLYLLITGKSGGYLELKVAPEDGALMGLAIIELPPSAGRSMSSLPASTEDESTPIIERGLWDRVNDFEPSSRIARISEEISYSRVGSVIALNFGRGAVAYLGCGRVRVGLSADGAIEQIIVDSEEE